MGPKFPSELPNFNGSSDTRSYLGITGAAGLGFGRTLYHSETKTKIYKSYEDLNTQFRRYQGELSMVRSKIKKRHQIQKFVQPFGVFGHNSGYTDRIGLKFCRHDKDFSSYNFHVLGKP